LLTVGLAIRCVALTQPLLDAHLLRQCQTAAATKSLMQEPGFNLSSKIPWLGDLDAHYVLELPLYNYLVLGANALLHDLDLSGKVTSILLWAGAFLCLQFIWRRMLRGPEIFWANLLFVFAPLSVFYGQAFMPEMLIQFLALGFILSILRYRESPSLGCWIICAGIGLLMLLVKFPETAHLYLLLAVALIRMEKWRACLRPRYLVPAAVTVVALKMWSAFIDRINMPYLPEWTSDAGLRAFIGPLTSRFHFTPWLTLFLYVAVFVFAGPSLLGAAFGLSIMAQERKRDLLGLWLVSLAAFYLVWFGNAATGQSYYNLPALAPACALFGIGLASLLKNSGTTVRVACALALLIPAMPLYYYLFEQDRQLTDAANWTRTNTQPNDIILFRPNHRWDLIDYPYDPILAYYSDRRTFLWTRFTPEPVRQRALERSRCVVVTHPAESASRWQDLVARIHPRAWQPEPIDWIEANGFRLKTNLPGFSVYERAAR